MTPNTSVPKYFFSLDAIRGFAALIVVLCHWQFFFYKDYTVMTSTIAEMPLPLYSWLSMFYNHAFFAVDLFFLLSGFIFFWFYADKISSRETSFNNFICYRVTRLYPVHFITLVALVFLQAMMIKVNGRPFIIQNNDAWHFVLNLLMIHSWGFESHPMFNGFNGPSWSVSVEFLLYLLFFIVSFKRLQHKKVWLIGFVIAGAVLQHFYSMIGQGIYSFFLGGLVFHLYKWLITRKNTGRITMIVTGIAVFIWLIVLTEYAFSYIRNASMVVFQHLLPGKSVAFDTALFDLSRNTFFRTFVSPATVLSLAMLETTKGSLKIKWLQVLGNASYAIYLIHFPLMVLFALVTSVLGIDRHVFQSPFMLLLFNAILIPVSIATHYYFELPVQKLFRGRLLKKTQPVTVVLKDL
ncbi:acyltransferase family protein [Chitinophaga sp. 22321]|uniref:Acyltransferase n=1 Tax=Chitinophaga hostae TaxID=2831022 RepID=A0ABS5ISN5_9BACT|nr:acyltransferase [Chitinophaga hostae]MBS0025968.1 acyltransferase [Chitinophaga hostae]